jgi:small multidrug resistance family-3 protein
MTITQSFTALGFLIIATALEVSGDATVRIALYGQTGAMRVLVMCAGGLLLFGYGFSLNLAPVEFRHVVGLYIATLVIMWQVINFFTFRTAPDLPIIVGGTLIVIGGLIITFWKTRPEL